MTNNPPRFFISFFLFSLREFSFSSFFPPNFISCPRPARLVATVTAFNIPASAIISASFSCCFAFKTVCLIFFFLRIDEYNSDLFILVVPSRTGCPLLLHSIILFMIALFFSSSV